MKTNGKIFKLEKKYLKLDGKDNIKSNIYKTIEDRLFKKYLIKYMLNMATLCLTIIDKITP